MFFHSKHPAGDELPPDPFLSGSSATAEAHTAERAELGATLASIQETNAVIWDAADGMRANLLARGWSPAAAEGLTYTWTHRMLQALINPTDSGEQPS